MQVQQGISIIFDLRTSQPNATQLLAFARKVSDGKPFELIALDSFPQPALSSTANLIDQLATSCFFRLLETEKRPGEADLHRLICRKARYPNIFFLHSDVTQPAFTNSLNPETVTEKSFGDFGSFGSKLGAEAFRTIKNFEGFLRRSYTAPLISAPFSPVELSCFSIMEGMSERLSSIEKDLSSTPRIDVIMPTFNRSAFILDSIQSVLNQNYSNFRLIIINDGSSDNTSQILETIQDPRVLVFTNSKNQGQSYSLNLGISNSDADLIAYLDSDNTWDKSYLSAMVGALSQLPDADAVFSGQRLFHSSNKTPIGLRFGAFNRSLLFNNNYIDRNSLVHKRSIHDIISGYDTNLTRFVDWDYILRASKHFIIYSIPVILTNYYYEKDAYTMTGNLAFSSDLDKIREKHESMRLGSIPGSFIRKQKCKSAIVVYLHRKGINSFQPCLKNISGVSIQKYTNILVSSEIAQEHTNLNPPFLKDSKDFKVFFRKKEERLDEVLRRLIDSLSDTTSDILLLDSSVSIQPDAFETLQQAAYSIDSCAATVPELFSNDRLDAIKEHVPYTNPSFASSIAISGKEDNIAYLPIFHHDEYLEISFSRLMCMFIKRDALSSFLNSFQPWNQDTSSMCLFHDYIRHVLNSRIFYISRSVASLNLQDS